MVILRPLIATAFLAAVVGSTQVGMADMSSEVKEKSSRTVTEVPAPPYGENRGTQVETHTRVSKTHKDETGGSVKVKKKSSTTTERKTNTDPFTSDTVHSETHSQQKTTTVTP